MAFETVIVAQISFLTLSLSSLSSAGPHGSPIPCLCGMDFSYLYLLCSFCPIVFSSFSVSSLILHLGFPLFVSVSLSLTVSLRVTSLLYVSMVLFLYLPQWKHPSLPHCLYISMWPFPLFTCNGVDSCHHQQDDCGEIKIPAQGHLDEEGSREDISLQKASPHKSMPPNASRMVAVGVSPTFSRCPQLVLSCHQTRRTRLKCHADGFGLGVKVPHQRMWV